MAELLSTLATLHTSSGAKTIHRIVDAFPERAQPQIRAQLAPSLEAVLSQALLPRVGRGLAVADRPDARHARRPGDIRQGHMHQIYPAIQAGQECGISTMNEALAPVQRGLGAIEEPSRIRAISRASAARTPSRPIFRSWAPRVLFGLRSFVSRNPLESMSSTTRATLKEDE